MIPDSSRRAGLHSSLVLAAYIEPLVRGRRVAVLGDATLGLAEELLGRGARLVHAYDPDAVRAAEALARAAVGRVPAVSFAVLAGDLGVRDGAFDVVILPDLSIFADPAEILRRARRLVAQAGAAVVVSPNGRAEARRFLPEARSGHSNAALGYYELYDLVSLQFAKVRMVGQAPFVGYTIADFAAAGEPEVSVDTSLLTSSEEPEHFIAIAGDRPVALESYTVVELSWAEVAEAQGTPALPGLSAAELAEERLALTEARTRLLLVNAELEKHRDKQLADAREIEAKAITAAALSARVVELELELEAHAARAREVEARAGDNHVRAERAGHQIRDLEEELRRQRDRGTRLTKQLDDEKKARTKAEVELGMVRGLSTSPPPAPEPPAAPTPRSAAPETVALLGARERLAALDRELEAARARISELELEQAETRRRVPVNAPPDALLMQRINDLETALNAAITDLADVSAARDEAVDLARRSEASGALRAQEHASTLAGADAARRAAEQREEAHEADLARAAGRIAELEQRLAEAHRSVAELERKLAAGHAQLAEGHAKVGGLERDLAREKARSTELERKLGESRSERAELVGRIVDAERRPAALEARLADAEERAAALGDARASAEAAAAEIATLEGALRDRGRVVAELQREVREGERIGKELIAELAGAATNGASIAVSAGPAADVDDLRAQLDRLATGAARAEADLQASAWRIAQLERLLADAELGPREATDVQVELEAALAAARDEVASLRRSLAPQG